MEYKFKKGDRVVATKTTDYAKEGWIGTVDERSHMPWVNWDNGKRSAIIESHLQLYKPAPQVKIGVHCENQMEHETLMRYMDSLGLKCYNTYKPTHEAVMIYAKDNPIIQFHDVFGKCAVNAPFLDGYSIVPFKVFAAFKGIDYTPIVEVKLNDTHTATIENGMVKVGCQTFEFGRIEALYNAVKEAKK